MKKLLRRGSFLTLFGDEKVTPSELRGRYSEREIDCATGARDMIVEEDNFAPLPSKRFKAGSPNAGWEIVDRWFEPRRAAQKDF